MVKRAEAGIEVIAIRVDQVERQDWDIHLAHGRRKFFYSAGSAAETVAGENAGFVGVPEKVAVSFEEVFAEIDFDHAIIARVAPVFIERDFALAGRIDHAAGNDKFSVSGFFADENLIRGEDHILEALDRIDGLDGASVLLQNATEILPLSACFDAIYRTFARHVGIFLIHNIEIIRGTHEHGGHRADGSSGGDGEASIATTGRRQRVPNYRQMAYSAASNYSFETLGI